MERCIFAVRRAPGAPASNEAGQGVHRIEDSRYPAVCRNGAVNAVFNERVGPWRQHSCFSGSIGVGRPEKTAHSVRVGKSQCIELMGVLCLA